jgi:multisubunit Na+/H+ antiporter MnhG subunit
MEGSTISHVLFLIVGVLLVFIDGQLMRRSGTTYLKAVYPEVQVADSVNQLVTVLFHLVGVGIVALVSTVGPSGGDPFQSLVTRIGVLLLVLAATHGVTLWALARMRGKQRERQLQDELTSRTEERLDKPVSQDPGTGEARP